MAQRRWKVGLLGAGFICEAHAKSLNRRSDVEIVAICDYAREKAEDAAAKFGIRQVFTSLDEMLNAEIDVVHVLIPPDKHTDATRRILESGRHVFLEKPMALIAAECKELAELAAIKKVKLSVDHNFLFLPSFDSLRNDARNGTLGKLDQITVNWMYPLGLLQSGPFNNWMLREPGNLFLELGPHLVAFVMDLVGPLDSIKVTVSRPIDLPGGSRVYRQWHVHGLKGHTAVDLILSVVPGPPERSVIVRGHGALARCDFDRDLYHRDEPMGYGLLFDNFFTATNVAKQLGGGAVSNLVASIVATLKKSPASNPFGASVASTVNCFYETINGQSDTRLERQFGVNVIAECERIVAGAEFEHPEGGRKVWAVIPPAQRPTVLVLGGTGFIGQYLVRALVARGIAVRVVTRSMGSAQIALAGLPIELVQGDLADPSFIDSALENIDVVYDLAKATGKNWEDYYKHDVLITQNIAQRALAKGIKRFIYTGTIDSYYSANARHVITSDTPLDPQIHSRNHYARSKAACETLLMEMHRDKGLPLVVFRPGIVIGKGCSPAHWGVGMYLSDTRVQFWGDGKSKLPLVLVEDVADALVLGLDKSGIEGQTFLLTDEQLLSGRDYVEAVSAACGTRIRADTMPAWKSYGGDLLKEAAKHLIKHPNRRIPSYRDWDSRSHRSQYDSSRTRDVLAWRPAGSREALIDRGIVAAVREYFR